MNKTVERTGRFIVGGSTDRGGSQQNEDGVNRTRREATGRRGSQSVEEKEQIWIPQNLTSVDQRIYGTRIHRLSAISSSKKYE